ncbi:MAG TPA: prepilin-type N-terminal cleavage/methylation domain-containing protein, partial [Candidatus Paceibacterota bacterium]|nr:prepilin-type N-terminal cleavage/methylation domain-containing protein [Candidatus Paceibacterota bacterium]
MNLDNNQAFTLIELLVVIAILSILAVAVTLILNPAQLIRQGRDSTRL